MDQSTVGGVVVEANDAMLQFPYGASQALVTFGKYSVLGLCCHVWAVLPFHGLRLHTHVYGALNPYIMGFVPLWDLIPCVVCASIGNSFLQLSLGAIACCATAL